MSIATEHTTERGVAAADAAAEPAPDGTPAATTTVPDGAVTYPIFEVGHHGTINPADLIVGSNCRTTVVLSKTFVNSIKAVGVRRRIHVYQDEAGHVIVQDGQRRTLGAVEAGQELVPFEVVDTRGAAGLIYEQLALNDHDRMTTADTAAALHQLSLLGEPAGRIAKTSGRPPKEVRGLIAVGGSAAAADAAARYDLDLGQSLVFAEFDGDEEAQRLLHEAVGRGGFTHVAQRLRDDRAERNARQKLLDEASAAGITVVDGAGYGRTEQPLYRLGITDDAAVEQHRRDCRGHAVCLESTWADSRRVVVATPVCVDPIANGHTVPDHLKHAMGEPTKTKIADMEPAAAEKARAERKRVIANNKAWQSAVVVRRAWLAEQFVTRTKIPDGAELFIVAALLRNPFFLRDGLTSAVAVLASAMLPEGTKRPLVTSELAEHLITKIATSRKAVVLAAAMVFYAWEDNHGGDDRGKNTWRQFTADDTRILQQMEVWGYPLSDVEQLVAHPKPATRKRSRRPATVTATDASDAAASDAAPDDPAAAPIVEPKSTEDPAADPAASSPAAAEQDVAPVEEISSGDNPLADAGGTDSAPHDTDRPG